MNIYALLSGILIAFFVILHFRKGALETSPWAYPLLLASFPFYYFAFALFVADIPVLGQEVLSGLLFFALAGWSILSRQRLGLMLVGLGCLLHGVYDFYHDALFINPGMPDWWIEFCGSIDWILGIYLIARSLQLPEPVARRG